MSEEQINLEYQKLTMVEGIRPIIEHNQFRQAFLRTLRQYKDAKVEVTQDNKIRISREGNYPYATNGIYKGIRDCDRISFSLEKIFREVRLVVAKNSASIHVIPDNPTQDVGSCSKTLEIYDDYSKVAESSVTFFENPSKRIHPAALLTLKPELNPNFAINSAVDEFSFKATKRGYIASAQARIAGFPGVCKSQYQRWELEGPHETIETINGYYKVETEYPNEMRLYTPFAQARSIHSTKGIHEEQPLTVDNTSVYAGMTINQAIATAQYYYDQAIENRTYKSL